VLNFELQAAKFIEQGHVRVGPDTITDPAYLVTRYALDAHISLVVFLTVLCRHMEDFVTWVDTSKLKRTIMKYNDEVRLFIIVKAGNSLIDHSVRQLDDFDLL
jgi:ribosomal protein S4